MFFGSDFVSVTATPGVEWRGLKPGVLEVLLDHFASGAPLFTDNGAAEIAIGADETFPEDPADAEIIEQIKDLIEGARAAATIKDAKEWREGRPAQVSVPEANLVAAVREVLARHKQ